MTINPNIAAEHVAIRKVLTTYTNGIDKRDPALLQTAFWPEAHVDYGDLFRGSSSEFTAWATAYSAPNKTMAHILGQSIIDIGIDGDQATGETYVTAYLLYADTPGDTLLMSLGRYHDKFERRGEIWRIIDRRLSMDLQHTQPFSPLPTA